MKRLIFANALSLVGAVFLWLSCTTKNKGRVHFYQMLQCSVLVVSQLVFGRPSGAVAMGVACVRNGLKYLGIYNAPFTSVLLILTLALGVYFNTGGVLGLVPVLAGSFFTVAVYRARSLRTLKISMIVLLSSWVIYSALIYDFVGLVSNGVALVLNLLTIRRTGVGFSAFSEKK